jgi:uncharacterized membrane protein YhaH (DUF805 family)
MSFFEAVAACFNKYATFTGRASRAEYWWFVLFTTLVWLIINALGVSFGGSNAGATLGGLFLLLVLVPSLAVGARRLHDMNVSGWWLLLHLTGVGSVILLIWMLFAGTPGSNRFGEPVVSED